jgi:hypothetical protein
MTWTAYQLVTFALAMVGTGAIGIGIPAGYALARIPVPVPPPAPSDEELGWLADDLEQAAAMIRARAQERPGDHSEHSFE